MFQLYANLKESKECGVDQQVSAKAINGIGGVKNERHLEVGVMGQQAGVEDVVPLLPSEIVEEKQV